MRADSQWEMRCERGVSEGSKKEEKKRRKGDANSERGKRHGMRKFCVDFSSAVRLPRLQRVSSSQTQSRVVPQQNPHNPSQKRGTQSQPAAAHKQKKQGTNKGKQTTKEVLVFGPVQQRQWTGTFAPLKGYSLWCAWLLASLLSILGRQTRGQ